MKRALALLAVGATLSLVDAKAQSGCLNTDTTQAITWTLPPTPGSPNWILQSNGIALNENTPAAPFSEVPFSATFWRRSECPTQLLMTFSASAQINLGIGQGFTVSQAGYNDSFQLLIVNDPSVVAGNLFNFNLQGPISGVAPLVSFDHIDASQALSISFTPEIPDGLSLTHGSPVLLQIPAASSTAPFAIGPGITGSWFDPSESGHGFSVEILPNNQFLAYWYVYAPPPQGGQAWIVATGPYSDNTAVNLTAFWDVGSGALFPPAFNPNTIHAQQWGTITFTFTDCNNGTASWQPTAAGYTAGSIPIARLTLPVGLTCP